MRFIEGDPMLYSVSKSLEAGNRIMLKIFSASTKVNHSVSKMSSSSCLFLIVPFFMQFYVTYIICVLNHPS